MLIRSKGQIIKDEIVTHGLLIFFSLIMIFPVALSLMTSFKTKTDVMILPPQFFPPTWTLEGYRKVFQSDLIPIYMPNSAINAFTATFLTVILASFAAYGFSRFKFKGSRALQMGILGLMMIPGVTNLVSYYKLGSQLGILSTHLIMILVYTGFELPFGLLILKNFFDAIPIDLEEAAKIDGCKSLQVLWHVIIPLSLPGVFVASLLILVYLWNEFLFAVTLLSANEARTAMVGLYDFQTSFEVAYHALSAASIIVLLPMLVIFLLGRKTFFRAMMEGALKG